MSYPPSNPVAADLFTEADLLPLLEVSLTGLHLARPLYDPAAPTTIVDFSIDYVNPAGQRMMGLAQQFGGTLLSSFPYAAEAGVFDYYRRAFETGAQLSYQANYLDNYFKYAARRQGARLFVSFTDTANQPRSTVEQALRESQASEQQALREAEQQQQRLYDVLLHLPAQVATYVGPDHVFEFVNARY